MQNAIVGHLDRFTWVALTDPAGPAHAQSKLGPARLIGVVSLMTWLAIESHELGHLLVYALCGHAARLTFQRVTPLEPVPDSIRVVANAAGPLVSIALAVVLLWFASRRASFAWSMAAFATASLRLFPCTMDLLRAIRGRPAFSDEGEVAHALFHSAGAIFGLVLFVWLACAALSFFAGRTFAFRTRKGLKVVGIYAATLAIGIVAVIADDLIGANHHGPVTSTAPSRAIVDPWANRARPGPDGDRRGVPCAGEPTSSVER